MKIKITALLIFIISLAMQGQVTNIKVADSLLQQGNYQKAIKILETKKSFETLSKIASIYKSIGNYSKAITYYKKALLINNSSAVEVKLANVYTAAGFPLQAINLYENIFQKDSSNLLVASNLGKLYLANYKTTSAKKIYQYLKKKDTANPNYPYQLAVAFGRLDLPFKMGNNYLEAYKRDSLHIKSIYRLAKFYKDLRFKDSTMLFIDKGLKIVPNDINFNNLKSNYSYTLKDYKTTLKHLKRLDSLHYKSVNMYELFGLCYLNSDNFDLSEKSFKKALELNPKNPTIFYRLGSLYSKMGETKMAMLYTFRSINMTKLDKQYYLMGTLFNEEKKPKLAIEYFKKAFANNSKNYSALYALATTQDFFYKDKKIAYKNYQKYLQNFTQRNVENTKYATLRVKQIKEEYFLEGITLE